MATKFIKLNGKVRYPVTLFVPDTQFGKKYTCSFYPDEESFKILEESGCSLEKKQDTDKFVGEYYIRPRRDETKLIKGSLVEFGRPQITMADGSDFPQDVYMGDGTIVEMTLAVYKAGRFIGHRMEKIRVLDLVEYERPVSAGVKEAEKTEPSVKTSKPKMPF